MYLPRSPTAVPVYDSTFLFYFSSVLGKRWAGEKCKDGSWWQVMLVGTKSYTVGS